MVLEVLNHATHWEPVDVDICHRHKNRDLQALTLKVLVVLNNLCHNHTAIAWRKDKVGIVNLDSTWLAEKRDDKEPKHQKQHRDKDNKPVVLPRLNHVVEQSPYCCK